VAVRQAISRRRSGTSYVLEILLTVALVAGIYLWMTNGGPEWFGSYFAGQMVSTPRPRGDTPNEGHGEEQQP
jgi:hypothetical protein